MNNINRSNRVKKVNRLAQVFLQDHVNPNLSGQFLEHRLIFKLALILLTLFATILTGLVAGLIGNYIILNILISSHVYNYVAPSVTVLANSSRAVFSCAAIVVLTWLFSTLHKGLITGLKTATIASIVITIMLGIFKILNVLYIFNTLFVILICLILSHISLFLGYFSFVLAFFLSRKYLLLFKMVNYFSICLSALFFASISFDLGLFDNPQSQYLKEHNILPESIKIYVVMGSLLISIFIATVSLIKTLFSNSDWKDLSFIKSWTLRISSWGGISFYNLNLSNVNFRGAKLANTDLRARKLYRTCFQGVTGLERARVDSRYLDLENPKVQKLLTQGRSEDGDFSGLNLRGAYLQNAELRRFNFTDTDLTGADMQGADLRGSFLVRAQVIGVDFTNADLTGSCIEDWSINSQTCFTNVRCEYIYRKLDEHGEPIERYPINRNFEPREFESLYQEVGNVVELIFKEGVNWRAFSFTLQKLQVEDEGLGLQLKGIEKRGDLWVVKVTHNENASKQNVEQYLYGRYKEMKQLLTAKEQQINQLLGIATNQAEALKNITRQSFGNSFFIIGSTITNLAGSGQIDYDEAASKIRSIVANSGDLSQVAPVAQNFLQQLQNQSVATSSVQQAELIQQVILTEAKKDTIFKQFLLQQGQQIVEAIPESAIATAIRNAIGQLR